MSGINFKDTGMPRLGKVGVAQGVAVGKSTQGRWRKVNELRFVKVFKVSMRFKLWDTCALAGYVTAVLPDASLNWSRPLHLSSC